MSVKIGLDFGTHFTKICVEDSKDKRNRSYSFHKFIDLEGNPSLVFPSVVQLNKDNTLSYGFVDTDNAAMVDELQTEYIRGREEGIRMMRTSLKNLMRQSGCDLNAAMNLLGLDEQMKQEILSSWNN